MNLTWSGWFKKTQEDIFSLALLVLSGASGAVDLAAYSEESATCKVLCRLCPDDLRQTVAAKFLWPFNLPPSARPNKLALARGTQLCICELPEYSDIIDAFESSNNIITFESGKMKKHIINFNSGLLTLDWDIPTGDITCYLTDESIVLVKTGSQFSQTRIEDPFRRICREAISTSLALNYMGFDRTAQTINSSLKVSQDKSPHEHFLLAVANSIFSGMQLSFFNTTRYNRTKSAYGSGLTYILTRHAPIMLDFLDHEVEKFSQRISIEELHRLITRSVSAGLSRLSFLISTEAGALFHNSKRCKI